MRNLHRRHFLRPSARILGVSDTIGPVPRDRQRPQRYSDERPIGGTIETWSAQRLLSAHGLTRYSGSECNPAAVTEPVMPVEHWIDLRCHPSTRPETVHAIQVLVRRSSSAELQMTFRLDGDIPRIWFSSPGVPRIATQLWHHTCFEAFIAVEGQPTYHEFNFAPSGVQCWNCSAGCKGRRLGRCVGLQDLLAAGTLRIQQK